MIISTEEMKYKNIVLVDLQSGKTKSGELDLSNEIVEHASNVLVKLLTNYIVEGGDVEGMLINNKYVEK